MVFSVLRTVFQGPAYIVVACIAGAIAFVGAVWLPNISLIVNIMAHADTSFANKLSVPISLLGSIATNFTSLSAAYTIVIAVLFGVDCAFMAYLIRRRVRTVRHSGVAAGSLGIISAVLGIGCAACGSLVLTSVLVVFGAASLITFLPLRGGEFGILAVLLLVLSLYLIAKQIHTSVICNI